MIDTKYTYTPELPEEFKCKVPLPGTVQAFVTNGTLREAIEIEGGVSVIAKAKSGFIYEAAKESNCAQNVQIISFRDAQNTQDISFENRRFAI